MAQLLLISKATERPGINSIGDIVGVFEDDHVFSPAETESFDVKKVDGKAEEVRMELHRMQPDIKSLTAAEIKERVTFPKYSFAIKDEKAVIVSDACLCKIQVAAKIV